MTFEIVVFGVASRMAVAIGSRIKLNRATFVLQIVNMNRG